MTLLEKEGRSSCEISFSCQKRLIFFFVISAIFAQSHWLPSEIAWSAQLSQCCDAWSCLQNIYWVLLTQLHYNSLQSQQVYVTFLQCVPRKNLFPDSFRLYRVFFNWSAQFSVPKWKTMDSKSDILFHEILNVQKILVSWTMFFFLALKFGRNS